MKNISCKEQTDVMEVETKSYLYIIAEENLKTQKILEEALERTLPNPNSHVILKLDVSTTTMSDALSMNPSLLLMDQKMNFEVGGKDLVRRLYESVPRNLLPLIICYSLNEKEELTDFRILDSEISHSDKIESMEHLEDYLAGWSRINEKYY